MAHGVVGIWESEGGACGRGRTAEEEEDRRQQQQQYCSLTKLSLSLEISRGVSVD